MDVPDKTKGSKDYKVEEVVFIQITKQSHQTDQCYT